MKEVKEPASVEEMAALDPEDGHYLICKRNYDLAHANIFESSSLLMESALMLGDHDTARVAAAVIGETDLVESIIAAIKKPDDEQCACPHPVIGLESRDQRTG